MLLIFIKQIACQGFPNLLVTEFKPLILCILTRDFFKEKSSTKYLGSMMKQFDKYSF